MLLNLLKVGSIADFMVYHLLSDDGMLMKVSWVRGPTMDEQ